MGARSNLIRAIAASRLSIYDSLTDCPELYIATPELEALLKTGLRGLVLNQPLRTRSKVVKAKICSVLGYPIPKSFQKTQPRFPGQNFDTYVQKANNLQIWNEEISVSRRYVLIRVDVADVVISVRVVTGDVIAKLDTTGTLTQKYQAKAIVTPQKSQLVSASDTSNTLAHLIRQRTGAAPSLLPIAKLYAKLIPLIGQRIGNPGITQERNRGQSLHQAVCLKLNTATRKDDGQFPDVKEQLLEVKLQTAATIDLGLVNPNSAEPLANFPGFEQRDVRYAIFYAKLVPEGVQLKALVLLTGTDFYGFFQQFGGLIRNKKYQIPLPHNFFT